MDVRQEVVATGWTDLGVVTTSQAALATTQFAKDTAEALTATGILKAKIPYGAANIELRFYGTASNSDSNVVNIYGARDNDGYYQLLATLTLTTGTAQKGAGTELWADTVAETVDATPIGSGAPISPANDSIARYYFKPGGYKDILIIATTLNSTDVGVELATYSG